MPAIEEREIPACFSLCLVAKLGPMPDVLPTFSPQLRLFSSHLAEFMSRTGLLRQAALASPSSQCTDDFQIGILIECYFPTCLLDSFLTHLRGNASSCTLSTLKLFYPQGSPHLRNSFRVYLSLS